MAARSAPRGLPGSEPAPRAAETGASEHVAVGRTVRARLLTVGLLAVAVISLLLAVPGLSDVASEIGHVGAGWLLLACVLELASCTSFVVIFRRFFAGVPASQARELAWTEMGSGALLPGGGVGSLAVGGWLLHLAGMPTRQIVRSSSGLFFLTSAVNVAALVGGGVLLATGVSGGEHDLLRAGLPILAGLSVGGLAVAATRARSRTRLIGERAWTKALVSGIDEAMRVLRHPGWRLLGAVGYLAFDIGVLWAALNGVGFSPPLAVLLLGYIIGYLGNLIPVPGGIGVLEGGLAGTLVLYGAPVAQSAAAVLIYHAIAFWIPSLGGVIGYRRLRARVGTDPIAGERVDDATVMRTGPRGVPDSQLSLHNPTGAHMNSAPDTLHPLRDRARRETMKPAPRIAPTSRTMHPRYLEAHAAAWLRALRNDRRVQH